MKKIKLSAMLSTAMVCFLLVLLNGCYHQTTDSSQGFSFALPNRFNKVYIGESDGPLYESFDSYKQTVIQEHGIKGAIVAFHCIEVTPYISISHQGDDIIVSGKTVAKCIIDAVAESFNGCELTSDSTVTIEQQYYFEPASEDDCIKMFKEFGAELQTDQLGNLIGMTVGDGDYVLQHKDDVEYVLKLHKDVLPLSVEQNYSGLLLLENGKEAIRFILPTGDIKAYESFVISDNYSIIANEIKNYFDQ